MSLPEKNDCENMAHHAGVAPTFLGIPHEIRMLIYDFLLHHKVLRVSAPSNGTIQSGIIGGLAILRVNRQIYDEASQLLQVRVLTINKSALACSQQGRSARQAARPYQHTIEHVHIEYGPEQVHSIMTCRIRDSASPLAHLAFVLGELSGVRVVTINCDDLNWRMIQNSSVKQLVARLASVLPAFGQIVATARDVSGGLCTTWNIQIRLVRPSLGSQDEVWKDASVNIGQWDMPVLTNTVKIGSDVSKPRVKKVLLDVMSCRQSHRVRVLTIDPVDIENDPSPEGEIV